MRSWHIVLALVALAAAAAGQEPPSAPDLSLPGLDGGDLARTGLDRERRARIEGALREGAYDRAEALLQEVVELALGKVGLVIEIKQVPALYPGLEEKLLNMLRQLGAMSECAVVSFNHAAIHELRKMEPALQLGIIEGARPMHPGRMLREAGADVYSPHWGAADPQVVQEVHAAGGAVGVWPVDDDTAVAWCKWSKPDSIFTNRPKEIGAALRNWAVV